MLLFGYCKRCEFVFFSDVLYTCSFMFCEMYYSKICTIPTNMENFNYRLEIIFINKF